MKQYNLVLISDAHGKVTLAVCHMLSGIPTYGLKANKREISTQPMLSKGSMVPFTFLSYETVQNLTIYVWY